MEVRRFERHRDTTPGIHPYLRSSEQAVLDGQAVIRAISDLLKEGFRPRLVIAHGGNGLLLFLRQLLPEACLVAYFEWWLRDQQAVWLFGEDSWDGRMRMTVRNGISLQELELCDRAVTPTEWQRQQFPQRQKDQLQVVFDGCSGRSPGAARLSCGAMRSNNLSGWNRSIACSVTAPVGWNRCAVSRSSCGCCRR